MEESLAVFIQRHLTSSLRHHLNRYSRILAKISSNGFRNSGKAAEVLNLKPTLAITSLENHHLHPRLIYTYYLNETCELTLEKKIITLRTHLLCKIFFSWDKILSNFQWLLWVNTVSKAWRV